MNRLARSFALLLSFTGLLLGAADANALACTSVATGNWGVAGTWTSVGNCNRVPTAADTVTIATGHTVTVNVATANVLSVTVNAGAILTQSSALNSAGVLSVAGTLNSTNTMAIGGATTVTGALNITATTGTRTFTGLVTVNAGGTWNNSINELVTFRGGITNNGTFTAGTGTQTFDITAAQAIGGANPINFGGIVAVVGAVTVTNNNTSIVTIAGNLTGSVAGSTWVNAANSTLNYGGAAAPIATGVLTASAVPNTVNYIRAGAQTMKQATYYHLTVSGSGIKATGAITLLVNGTTTVTGTATLNISSTTGTKTFVGPVIVDAGCSWTNTANELVTFRGGITHNGVAFTAGTGTQTFDTTAAQSIGGTSAMNFGSIVAVAGAVTVTNNNTNIVTITGNLTGSAVGSTWVNAANSTLNYGGAAAPMGTRVFTASAVPNTVNYNRSGAQPIKTPTASTYHHLQLSSVAAGAKTAAAGLTVNGDFTMSGAASFTASTFTHNFAGNWIVNTTAAAPLSVSTTSVINFNAPAIPAPTSMGGTTAATIAFADVNINNTSGVTFNDNASFSTGTTPTLTVAAGATLTPAPAVIISGTGTLTGTGTVQVTRTAAVANFASQYTIATRTLTNLTVDFAGVGVAQTVDALTYGSATGGGLTVSNASGVSLAANTTVAGTLTLAGGVVSAGAFTLISSGDCTTKVARTSGHVAGLLQLRFPTGAPSCTFHVGDATAYRPINASFASVSVAGNLVGSVSQVAGEHPNIATSTLDSTKDVNRYWTLTNPVGGTIAFTTYTGTLNFINPTDFDAGATPASFEIERWDGAAWNITTLGAATSTSTSASGLPSFVANSSNSFAVGEKNLPPTVISINCSVPSCPATSAATVSWTITFSKSVTGVDATDFALAATGVSGAYITAASGSGTSWTVTANTGIGSGTLGLNLVDDDTIVDAGGRKLGGTGAGNGNFTGEIYPITAAPALAEYRMDEASWNGTANEATDSGTGGFNGTAAGLTTKPTTSNTSPAIAGSPGTCRYGVFNRSNKDYLALAGFPNLAAAAGDFTITAWINVADNTLPGQRIFIDDETNSSPGGWGFSVGETTTFGVGGLRFYYRQPSVYTLDTVAIPSNQWLFVALSVQLAAGANASTATIYAWNTAGTLVTSNTGTFTWTAGSDPGPSSIGGETNASGEGSNVFGFGGNLDEIRVYQKALSQAALAAIATQSHVCPINVPDHLEIQSSGSGLTCAASTLTIKACTDAAIPCATPYTLGVSGTLSATGTPTVNWNGGTSFSIGGTGSVTKDVQVATAGMVTFGVASATPTPTNATACNFGTNPGNNNCVFTANTAGFIFSDSATGNTAYTIPALTSGTAQNTDNLLWLRAVQASTANAAVCTPAIISQTVTVDMGYTCNNPAACQAGNLGVINGTAIAPAGTAVSLAFDANGSAKITSVRYDDVGEITLTANKTVTPFGGGTAITLNGNSNAFVVKPAEFVISGIKCSTIDAANCGAGALAMATPGDNPAAADAAGVTFIRAGHPFTVTVTAKNALGNTTKNYGQETTAESVKLTSVLAGGLGLTNNPMPGGTFGAFSNGEATGTAFTWNEAGIITLTPSVADADYLGAGDVAGTTSGNVGRFYAAQFALSPGGVIANRTGLGGVCAVAGCDTFTYMGEQTSAMFTLTAQAVDGTTTLQNYNYSATAANNFARLDPTAIGNPLALAAVDTGTPRTVATLDTTTYGVASGSFAGGIASITAPFAVVRGASPSGPFDALDVGVAPVDGDGAALATLDLAVNAGGTPNTHGKVGSTKARYGRMKISNAHGSELLNLPIPMEAQYWQGQYWAQNSLDDATTIVQNNIKLGNAAVTINSIAKDAAGKWRIVLNKLLTPGTSSVCLDLDVGATGDMACVATTPLSMPYLQTGATFDKDPVSRATFGVYKGSNEFIYLRETY